MKAIIRFTVKSPVTGYSKSVDMDITAEVRAHFLGFANSAAENSIRVDYVLSQVTMEMSLPATGLFLEQDLG